MVQKIQDADPSCKTRIALAWACNAANCLENRFGLTPAMLVFGTNATGAPPDSDPANPTSLESDWRISKKLQSHLQIIEKAREACIEAQANVAIKEALKQRLSHRKENCLVPGRWVYWKDSTQKRFRGPAKISYIDGKTVHVIEDKKIYTINSDQVLLQRTGYEALDPLLSLPPVPEDDELIDGKEVIGPDSDTLEESFEDHENLPPTDPGTSANAAQGFVAPATRRTLAPGQAGASEESHNNDVGYRAFQKMIARLDDTTAVPAPVPAARDTSSGAATMNYHEPASASAGDRDDSEVSILPNDVSSDTAKEANNQGRETAAGDVAEGSLETVAAGGGARDATQEAVRRRDAEVQPTTAPVRTSGRLAGRQPPARPEPTVKSTSLKMMSCNTCGKKLQAKSILRHVRDVHGVKGQVTAKDVAVEVVRENPRTVENPVQEPVQNPPREEEASGRNQDSAQAREEGSEGGTMGQTLFITTKYEEQNEPFQTLHTLVRREEFHTEKSMEAKKKELRDFETFQVYEEVDKPKGVPIISTTWVLVDKEKDGKIQRKARLCLRGDQEDTESQVIHTDAPTVNKINLKIILGEAVRRGWSVNSSDVTRAFLQTSEITRDVFVKPPKEAGVHHSKVWRLLKPAYGMCDAAHSFYLNFAEGLINQKMEVNRTDNAMFMLYSDKSRPGDDHRSPDGLLGAHVDDFLETGGDRMKNEVLKEIRSQFVFGTHEELPFKYVGFNIDRDKDQKQIVIDQDHYTEEIKMIDMKPLSNLNKNDVLPQEYQTIFRSVVSKLNMLAATSRPDITYGVKTLTMKYGKAQKLDLSTANRIIKQVHRGQTALTIPDLGNIEDWALVAFTDASTKKIDGLFHVAGHIVFLVNQKTHRSIPLTWASKKISRVVHSSLMAETIAATMLIGTIFFIKESLKQVYGKVSGDLKTLVLVDNKDLHEAVHSIKTPGEKRCTPEIFQLKQAMVLDNLITELRLVPGHLQMADALTKPGRPGQEMMEAIRLGRLDVPGGLKIQRPEKLCTGTWAHIVKAQSESFGEEDDNLLGSISNNQGKENRK